MAETFDFPAYRRAVEAQDVEAWLAFFAPDAEWWVYCPDAPPRAPHKMVDQEAMRARLASVAGAEMELEIVDEVLGDERIAFAAIVTQPDGRRFIQHVILHLANDQIARQVDVEKWD